LNPPTSFPDLPSGKAICVGVSLEWELSGPSQKTLKKYFPESDYPRLRFRVLPELDSPLRTDHKRWVDLVEITKPGLLSPTKWDALGRLVAGLFEDEEKLPMRDLYDKFFKLFD
jgi:hypothetical protein